MSGGDMLMEARDISRLYGPPGGVQVRGVESVTLSLRRGEILGLVGESGCGKSTLAKILVGLESARSGSLALAGRAIFGPGTRAVPAGARDIQMVFQDPAGSLDPRMRVRDIVAEGPRIRGRLSRAEIRARVVHCLALVGLGEECLDKFPHEFSGGQRQRVCIARSIILDPALLIADEAVSALDVSVQMQILNLLLDLRDRLNLSIVFISHDMGVIEYLCDRVAVMYAGRVVEENAARALLDAPRHPCTAALRAARPALDGPRALATSGHAPPEFEAPFAGDGCRYAPRCSRADARCAFAAPELARDGDAAVACHHPLP